MNIDITPEDFKIVQVILKKNVIPNGKVWIFGSRAKNTAKLYSDLDLAVDFGRILTLEELTMLKNSFEDSLLPYKVDIVDLYSLHNSFKKIIDQDKKLIFP